MVFQASGFELFAVEVWAPEDATFEEEGVVDEADLGAILDL